MSEKEALINGFAVTSRLVEKFASDMTHEESIATPSFKANSFNWVLGHILVGRDRVLNLLDRPAILTSQERVLYKTGSDTLSPERAVSIERLMKALRDSQALIKDELQLATEKTLNGLYDQARQQTVADRISGLHWHETYHVGQLEILRQVSRERDSFP